jgi:hypothetical protein
MTFEDSQARVVIENNMTESFNISVGVRHGDALSVTLFSLVLDYIIEKLDIRRNVSTKMAHISACADDVIIIYGNLKALEEALHELDNIAPEIGLIIDQEKIKIYKSKKEDTQSV